MPDRHQLVFCQDGTLRFAFDFFDEATQGWKEALLPVTEVEKMFHHSLFLYSLNGSVEVEKDTTVGALMNGLRPWTLPLSDMIGSDVLAFINEAQRPVSIAKRQAIFSIVVSASIAFESRVEYLGNLEENFKDMETTREFVTAKFLPRNAFDVSVSWSAAGTEIDSPIRVGLLDLPVYSYAHVPVRIDTRIAISDQTQMMPERMITGEPLLNPTCPMVKVRPWGKNAGRHLQMRGHCSPDFQQFARAFLEETCRFRTPQQRDEHLAGLKSKQSINTALDKQDGIEHATFARGAFDSLYAASSKMTEETLRIMQRAAAKGVAVITRVKVEDD